MHGARRMLEWLHTHPGDGWQQRWQHAAADAGTAWIATVAAGVGGREPIARHGVTDGVTALLLGRTVLPDYGFFLRFRTTALFRDAKTLFGPEAFAAVTAAGVRAGHTEQYQDHAERSLAKICLHTGRDVDQLTADDLLGFREWGMRVGGKIPTGLPAGWDLLRETGVLQESLPLRRLGHGQLTSAEIVDGYGLKCRPVRDVLVRYLDERRPALDYGSLRGIASRLIGNFWADLECHHPSIDSLRLPAPVAEAWKQRLAFLTRPGLQQVERKNRLGVLMTVRAFYLDIAQWAVEDPFWVPWAVPSPVRQSELGGRAKHKKQEQARSHQRVRERLPRLLDLVDTAESHHRGQQALLTAAEAVVPGEHFTIEGRRWRRLARAEFRLPNRQAQPVPHVLAEDPDGVHHDLTRSEDEGFWAWAIIETLRHAGIRCEELLEITQLALVSYRLADTGETVPLLQIVPSKSNEERLLLVSPELASVLATVITRLRTRNGGMIPLVARYDPAERTTGSALPHLFQRRMRWKHDVLTPSMVRDFINDTVTRAGLTDTAGQPLHFRPHDFRRIFTTQAVAGGLPVHIAARLLGHASVTTVEPYLAVFQDDLVRSYRAFLNTRRADRPTEEYREPTEQEWHEFQQHFHTRKLELGDCARPYGTPCNHEHACVRCPMLRVDPAQRPRLLAIIRNLTERIDEARINGWLGEIDGLKVSLTKAQEKLAALDRSQTRLRAAGPVNLGMPGITEPSAPPP
ncbi:tyrosine-type recombinase/integrase [Streptomyces shenzhenensis]|uniref:tyrosine-type recombinase/integrase n=1 Tax=Streptomyces shenzhenensis TaxID=943815 RepID=UPI001F466504|nr:site-specific integrase [Streptomyces shenzhenensis]